MDGNFICERIVRLRQSKGVSARDMSLSIGQNINYINQIENNKALPSMQVFLYICEYLGITPQEFFDEESTNPPLLNALIRELKILDDKALHHILGFVREMNMK